MPQVGFQGKEQKIGAIIGTGGKVIREIIEKTRLCKLISRMTVPLKFLRAPGQELMKRIGDGVKTLGGIIERVSIWEGKIRRYADFGISR